MRTVGVGIVSLALGFGAGWVGHLRTAAGIVEIHVPGAMTTSVACGRLSVNADGDTTHFVASPGRCRVEAALTPVMPLRGEIELSGAGRYVCSRRDDSLDCGRRP